MYYTAGDDDEMVGEKNAGYQAEESESSLEGERREEEEGKEE